MPSTTMYNLIGGAHLLSNKKWVLSMVRKPDATHAFLVIEGMLANKYIAYDAHLVIKEGSNGKKGSIVFRQLALSQVESLTQQTNTPSSAGHYLQSIKCDKSVSLKELQNKGKGCSSMSWGISREQAIACIALIEAFKIRGEEDKIDYIVTGKTYTGGFFGHSLETTGCKESKDKSGELAQESRDKLHQFRTNIASIDMSKALSTELAYNLVDASLCSGHSCVSWARHIVECLDLNFPKDKDWHKFIVHQPKNLLKDGKNLNMDEAEPTTNCSIL